MQKNNVQQIRVPDNMIDLLVGLFGPTSGIAWREYRTTREWKHLFRKINDELFNYLEMNINSDFLHMRDIEGALLKADKSLEDDFFWLGYIEGLIRLILLLMGDIPLHLKSTGRKCKDHYLLNQKRTIFYNQNTDQKIHIIYHASRNEKPRLSKKYHSVIMEYRKIYGFKKSNKDFLCWYKKKYLEDYLKLF